MSWALEGRRWGSYTAFLRIRSGPHAARPHHRRFACTIQQLSRLASGRAARRNRHKFGFNNSKSVDTAWNWSKPIPSGSKQPYVFRNTVFAKLAQIWHSTHQHWLSLFRFLARDRSNHATLGRKPKFCRHRLGVGRHCSNLIETNAHLLDAGSYLVGHYTKLGRHHADTRTDWAESGQAHPWMRPGREMTSFIRSRGVTSTVARLCSSRLRLHGARVEMRKQSVSASPGFASPVRAPDAPVHRGPLSQKWCEETVASACAAAFALTGPRAARRVGTRSEIA